MNLFSYTLLSGALALALASCGNKPKSNSLPDEAASGPAQTVQVPTFQADSAYSYVQAQTDFGPRVPNTEAHRRCGDYLAQKLESFGAKVYNQRADLIAYDNTLLKARNIIGSYLPDNPRRVLLCAHWDSRPYADQDPDQKLHRTPISGANDGASGVGVLLEVARQLQQQAPTIGIDLIFFDAEDYGTPYFYKGPQKEHTWCLGSQYWAKMPHVENYNARYGILLDMVGGRGAAFYQEVESKEMDAGLVKKIWNTAHRIGYGQFFPKREGSRITDDHIYVYHYRRIPCIDIINYDPKGDSGFGETWHTHNDTMEHIDRGTLQAVGQTVLEVIYNEK